MAWVPGDLTDRVRKALTSSLTTPNAQQILDHIKDAVQQVLQGLPPYGGPGLTGQEYVAMAQASVQARATFAGL